MPRLDDLAWVKHWIAMGEPFVTRVQPTPLNQPHWVAVHHELAQAMGLDDGWWHEASSLACLSGQSPSPLGFHWASVYSGHQFGVWAGQLGDGRALSLGEVQTPLGLLECQLKGAGQTPYSRFGDGRAVLRSSIREYLCSAAMTGLGIPTTQALSLIASADPVIRETVETAAVVCRVSPSFIRFGHFEHFSANGQHQALSELMDHVVSHPFNAPWRDETPTKGLAGHWLRQVVERTADLMADWQSVGFCHGVMNTDNMSILGLTLDYGPFQFMDAYNPRHICNHTDSHGRYAYDQQPRVAHWNLLALAHALHPVLPDATDLQSALDVFGPRFRASLQARWVHKLGLPPDRQTPHALETAGPVIEAWLGLLARHRADFTLGWRGLSRFTEVAAADGASERLSLARQLSPGFWPLPLASDPDFERVWEAHADWLQANGQTLDQAAQVMQARNPARVLRNHLAETAIRAAQAGDYREVQSLQAALANPFTDDPAWARYAQEPPDWAQNLHISCSS